MNPVVEEANDVHYDCETLTGSSSMQSPKKIVLESRGNSPRPPWYGPCKKCYCHKKPISPRLFSAPLNCLDDADGKESQVQRRCKIHDNLKTAYLDANQNVCNHEFLHKVKKVIDYEPKSNFLKNLQQEVRSKCTCLNDGIEGEPFKLQYNENRANYENNRPPTCYEKDFSKGLDKFNGIGEEEQVALPRTYSGDHSSTCKGKSIFDKSIGDRGKSDSLKNLENFRENNFFDCFSTATVKQDVPEHKCLHKFTVNDRLYPLPLNSDAYGVSRCSICNMNITDDKNIAKISQNVEIQTSSKNDFYNISKRYQNNLMPKYINIAKKNEKIQVQIPDERIANELCALNIRPYTCQPLNSYALRHQKGIMK